MYLPDKIMKAGSYSNPDYYGANTYQRDRAHGRDRHDPGEPEPGARRRR